MCIRDSDYIAPLTKQQATDGSNFSALDYAGTIDFTSVSYTHLDVYNRQGLFNAIAPSGHPGTHTTKSGMLIAANIG